MAEADATKTGPERVEFLLALVRNLCAIADPDEMIDAELGATGRCLRASRCLAELDRSSSFVTVSQPWTDPDAATMPPQLGTCGASDFWMEEKWDALDRGPVGIPDAPTLPSAWTSEGDASAMCAGAYALAACRCDGRVVGSIVVTSSQPREWKGWDRLLGDASAFVWPLVQRARA